MVIRYKPDVSVSSYHKFALGCADSGSRAVETPELDADPDKTVQNQGKDHPET